MTTDGVDSDYEISKDIYEHSSIGARAWDIVENMEPDAVKKLDGLLEKYKQAIVGQVYQENSHEMLKYCQRISELEEQVKILVEENRSLYRQLGVYQSQNELFE